MSRARSPRRSIATPRRFAGFTGALALWVAFVGAGGPAGASNENVIHIIAFCAARFADDPDAQTECRLRQHAAARELVDQIELASETSREFKAAQACIERATVVAPAQIDWGLALRCYQNRTGSDAAPEAALSPPSESTSRTP